MITVKQMAAWAQNNGVSLNCATYEKFIACKTWEEVINSNVAREFFLFFQRNMAYSELGVNWKPLHDIKISQEPSLTLEEEYQKDLEITAAYRIRDDAIKAASIKFNVYYRDNGSSNVPEFREYSRERQDENTKAERRLEDTQYEIEERYRKIIHSRVLTLPEKLKEIPKFMERNTITRDCEDDEIESPEECNPLDINHRARGFDEYK